jgi:AAA+ ATPase superfamily predicted ATPase
VIGRRIGKTTLLTKALEGTTTLYFFVAKKMKLYFAKNISMK